VHAAERALFLVKGNIALRYRRPEAVRLEFMLAETARKKSPIIRFLFEFDQESILSLVSLKIID